MIEDDPIGNDARNTEHLLKLGPPPHVCLFCGLTDPRCLIAKSLSWLLVRVPRTVLEEHHILLRDLDPDFRVLLCVLCHFKVTQGYIRAGVDFGPEPNPPKRVALMLRAQAVFLKQLAERNWHWAELLDGEGGKHDRTQNH